MIILVYSHPVTNECAGVQPSLAVRIVSCGTVYWLLAYPCESVWFVILSRGVGVFHKNLKQKL